MVATGSIKKGMRNVAGKASSGFRLGHGPALEKHGEAGISTARRS